MIEAADLSGLPVRQQDHLIVALWVVDDRLHRLALRQLRSPAFEMRVNEDAVDFLQPSVRPQQDTNRYFSIVQDIKQSFVGAKQVEAIEDRKLVVAIAGQSWRTAFAFLLYALPHFGERSYQNEGPVRRGRDDFIEGGVSQDVPFVGGGNEIGGEGAVQESVGGNRILCGFTPRQAVVKT